ncbi:MAG TPA: methanogenesis marker 3 protein [Methanocorpusculum sp.]|nr:methanogenesis marker 3 protein [Methanocorpusculum sp.]
MSNPTQIKIITTAGNILIQLQPGITLPISKSDVPLRVHWENKYAVAFGPFKSEFIPDHQSYRYENGNLYLGCGGYDSSISYLMFIRSSHTADYGSKSGGGVIGTVIGGKGVLSRWKHGDVILQFEPVYTSSDQTNVIITNDFGIKLESGMQIISEIQIVAHGYNTNHNEIDVNSAKSVEHLLFALKNHQYHIDRSLSTYIRDHTEGKLDVPMELQKPRRESCVTIRTSGKSSGAIYIYTKDVSSHQHHTHVGIVTQGLELAKFAKSGTTISIKVIPDQLDLCGLPLNEAVNKAKNRGIDVVSDFSGLTDDRVVISQTPNTTLDILKLGKVELKTVDLKEVIDISLDYDHAPKSVDMFRRVTNLKRYSIGSMPLLYNLDDDMYLFKPDFPSNINIIPENNPTGDISPYTLAITNDSRPSRGIVGVRTVLNKEYGPTGEPYEGTNIIGKLLDPSKLKTIHDGMTVFIREIKP